MAIECLDLIIALKKVKVDFTWKIVLFIPTRAKGFNISKSALIPKRQTVFDFVYMVDMVDDSGSWVTWQNMTEAFNIDEELGTGLFRTSKNSKEVGCSKMHE